MLLKKLLVLANKLDKAGLYREASLVDRLAAEYKPIEYPSDFNPPEVEPPEEWEMELMNMEISPEAQEARKRYKRTMKPTDPSEVDEMLGRQKAEEKIQQGYSPDEHLMLRMHDVLDKFEDYPDYEDDLRYEETSEMSTTPMHEMDARTPTVELSEKQPGDREYFDRLMQREQLRSRVMEPSGPAQRAMPPTYEPSGPARLKMPPTYEPSGPARLKMPPTYEPSGPARKS